MKKKKGGVRNRRNFFIQLTVCLLLAGGALFFATQKKDVLVREAADSLQALLSKETRMNVRIGKISGKLNGMVRFEDVRFEDPKLPAGDRLVFRAKKIEVRYHLIDFLTKKFGSKIKVSVIDPEMTWRPNYALRHRAGFYSWMRDWALAQRSRLSVTLKNLKINYGLEAQYFSGIEFRFENDSFRLTMPLRHMEVWNQDLTTQLNVEGKFSGGFLNDPELLRGQFYTEGTVVNWTPLPWEAGFEFSLDDDGLEVRSNDFLGGMQVGGSVDFRKGFEMKLSILAQDYPLSNLEIFLTGLKDILKGRLDLDAHFQGDWEAPRFEVYARLTGWKAAANKLKAVDLHLSGVYPTMQISDSRLLFEDGSVMRFADKTMEFSDLFSGGLGRAISGSDQDTLMLGEWEFKRPEDGSDFLMQRTFGKRAKMHFKKFSDPTEEKMDTPDKGKMEVGFEYRLRGRDSLKLEMREDESFVGVERKMSF